jgi:hypothetical protein
VSRIPREARDGLMRAWLEILRDKYPATTWVPVADVATREDQLTTSVPDQPAAVAA